MDENKLTKMVVIKSIEGLKAQLKLKIQNKEWEKALRIIITASALLYKTNIYYKDEDLERAISIISAEMNLVKNTDSWEANPENVIFYDGFGFDQRGLIQIYLRALCPIKKVIYITLPQYKDRIPNVLNLLEQYGGEVYFLELPTYEVGVVRLNEIVQKVKPMHFFFYSYPTDVVGTTVMAAYKELMKRYLINLTDHAFWLGENMIDVCIEFRNIGAQISDIYRGIPKDKMIMIPYYPIVDEKEEFLGFPFEVKQNQKVIFSGGSLYKTLGDDNKYYKMVSGILEKYPDVIFWYAGIGDRRQMDKIIERYPGRAFITEERSDLFQVLKHCYFYLSTYPMPGGLMFQYAVRAGKVPVTLKYDDLIDGALLNQSELNIEFDTLEEVYNEIDRLFRDEDYNASKGESLKDAVISEGTFNEEIAKLLNGEAGSFPIHYGYIDVSHFQKFYMESITKVDFIQEVLTYWFQFC
jgi:hypothetical protein